MFKNVRQEKLFFLFNHKENPTSVYPAILIALLVLRQLISAQHVHLGMFFDKILLVIKHVHWQTKFQSILNVLLVIRNVLSALEVQSHALNVCSDITYLKTHVLLNALKNIKSLREIENAFTQDSCVPMTITTQRIEKDVSLLKELVIRTGMF